MIFVVFFFLSFISLFFYNICEFFVNLIIYFSFRDSFLVIVVLFFKDGSVNSLRFLKLFFIVFIVDFNLFCGFIMYFG